jgi:hypothetical protein
LQKEKITVPHRMHGAVSQRSTEVEGGEEKEEVDEETPEDVRNQIDAFEEKILAANSSQRPCSD